MADMLSVDGLPCSRASQPIKARSAYDIFRCSMSSLEDLRRRINELDRQILELVGKRQETSREVARAKRATGQATRDFNREKEVLLAAREAGRQYGVSPQVAENILRLLIRTSLTTQEQA